MTAVIYARYSSDNQREESIEGQIRECTAYAEKNGITVVKHYIDRALSAKTDNRPDFQQMIKDSEKRLFDIVLVWKLDRFARNRYDSAHYEYQLERNHVKLVSATEPMYKDGTGEWGIPYETKKKAKRRYFANYMDCKDAKISTDCISNAAIIYGQSVTPLEKRLKARICELCGTTESERYEIHHINKLKNLKGKEPWEIAMLAKRRKTLVVCEHCHHLIHNQ